jgi:Undecaprenyl-phosphate glucose phosphotransferase
MSNVVPSTLLQSECRQAAAIKRAPVLPPRRLISQPSLISAVLLFDALIIAGAGVATHFAWSSGESSLRWLLLISFGVAAASLAILGARWAYTIRALSFAPRQAVELALALMMSLAGLIVCSALLDAYSPAERNWLLYWFLSAWSLCVLARFAVAGRLARWASEGRLARRALIVGGGDAANELIKHLDRTASAAIQILGLFDDRDGVRSPENVGPYYKLGRFDDLVNFCREQRVDLLIIALPGAAEDRILHILKELWVLPLDVRIAASGSKLKLRSRVYNYIGDVPFLPIFDKPMSDWSVALKSIEDRLLAGLGLIVLSPLLALIALAVKLDTRGPVLFKQVRYGFNNEQIEVYKFRSMYVDQLDSGGAKMVTRNDARVTRVGRIIRKLSLDELPQLFNVAFKGDLSLVGPRPHALQSKAGNRLYDDVVEGYFARHRVRPGITGWAQVNGWRGETDTAEKLEQRVAHDLYYIENWSMLFDLRILIMTPLALLTAKNAY